VSDTTFACERCGDQLDSEAHLFVHLEGWHNDRDTLRRPGVRTELRWRTAWSAELGWHEIGEDAA
jgi:hypothetical protein